MQQIKLFKSVETEIEDMEKDINSWLASNDINVVSIVGNVSPQTPGRASSDGGRRFDPSDLFIAILYETD